MQELKYPLWILAGLSVLVSTIAIMTIVRNRRRIPPSMLEACRRAARVYNVLFFGIAAYWIYLMLARGIVYPGWFYAALLVLLIGPRLALMVLGDIDRYPT